MGNRAIYYLAIIVGIIVAILGILWEANIAIGYHPARGPVAIAVGVILIIIGIVGMVMARRPRI
jgi:sulfite exporter TauE/SafE